jgi:CheY-like chemotaxis protein
MSTVLIVDDYPAVRKTLRTLLEKLCSVVCIEASNGLDAIAKAEVLRPDLIILDLGMPEMNGFEAATVLQNTMPQVPLFMFTSHDRRDVEPQAVSVGMDLLQQGVDRSVIALWLGHESIETTEVYLHASMEMKEKALAKATSSKTRNGRYRPTDRLLAFLKSL